jgi:hypothetical protein
MLFSLRTGADGLAVIHHHKDQTSAFLCRVVTRNPHTNPGLQSLLAYHTTNQQRKQNMAVKIQQVLLAIVWILLLLFVAWPLASFLFPFHILLQPFTAIPGPLGRLVKDVVGFLEVYVVNIDCLILFRLGDLLTSLVFRSLSLSVLALCIELFSGRQSSEMQSLVSVKHSPLPNRLDIPVWYKYDRQIFPKVLFV